MAKGDQLRMNCCENCTLFICSANIYRDSAMCLTLCLSPCVKVWTNSSVKLLGKPLWTSPHMRSVNPLTPGYSKCGPWTSSAGTAWGAC